MIHLKDYLKSVETETDINFSTNVLKMNLRFLLNTEEDEDDDRPAVLDGNHIRLFKMNKREFKKYGIDIIDGMIYRMANLYNYEYEPELQKKFSHIPVAISKEELKNWIEDSL